jgi:hypothetical protein
VSGMVRGTLSFRPTFSRKLAKKSTLIVMGVVYHPSPIFH